MIWQLVMVSILHISASVQFLHHGLPDAGFTPVEPNGDCACRNREWTDAMQQANYFPEHTYLN